MKKIKWAIMTLTILLGVGGAFATSPHFDCRTQQQYYISGETYMPHSPDWHQQTSKSKQKVTLPGVSAKPALAPILQIPGHPA